MTLEELYIEEPLVKEVFENPDINTRKGIKPIYDRIVEWTFIDGNPLRNCSTDKKNIDKLNTYFKNLPDNSSAYLFLSAIRITFLKSEILEEWKPLVNRAYHLLSKRIDNVDDEFIGLLEYIEKEV